MLPFACTLLAAGRGTARPPAPVNSLLLEFAAGRYSNGAIEAATPEALAGYSFTRSGEQGAIDPAGAVQWFKPDVPAINGGGFHAYAAVTNRILQSQDIGTGPWAAFNGATIAFDSGAPAPDGTTSAERLTTVSGARSTVYQTSSISSPAVTASVFVRASASGASAAARIYNNNAAANGTGSSAKTMLTGQWQRLVIAQPLSDPNATLTDTHVGSSDAAGNFDPQCVGNIDLWQAQLLDGTFPDGGPLIRTAGTSAAIGASDLRLALANGDYTATFTFDDGSSQVLAVSVSDGLFRHPVAGALRRGIVRKTVVSAA